MKRWSVAIEVDVSFPAVDEEAAWERAGEIAQSMADQMEGRSPPGRRGRRSETVYQVAGNYEPGAILDA